MPVPYFAYASNMDPQTFSRRCPKAKALGRARLPGYRLAFSRYSKQRRGGSADVVEDGSSDVWGVLYEVDDGCLAAMDRVEDVPNAYRRVTVQVVDDAGQAHDAVTYMANKTGEFLPSKQYLKVIVDGARAYGLPEEYIRALEQVRTV